MPEGDALHRTARRLRVLVGEAVEVEAPHPRAAVKGIAERLDGRRLEAVEAIGKTLLLRFEGGLVLRNHLRMSGRWRLEPRGARRAGKPWLVLRGREHEAVLWRGAVLELGGTPPALGPDILAQPPDFDRMLANLRAADPARHVGEALLDQRLVAGIGNVWRAEALWEARVSPWRTLGSLADDDLRRVLAEAHRTMSASVAGARDRRRVYRRAGRGCDRCGARIQARLQGDHARTVYWCPGCQA